MLDDRDFERFRKLVQEHSGIHLSDNKRALLTSRLSKRLRHWGLSSFAQYHEHVIRDPGEIVELVNLFDKDLPLVKDTLATVSYTHLTLPTILRV